jgi:hypothetical protein
MIKLLDILNEINQEEIYPFKEVDQGYDEGDDSLIFVEYEFSTPQYPYKVVFNSGEYSPEDKTFDLSFGVNKGMLNKIDTFQMTGEGNAKKILKTVGTIIEDFLYQYDVEGAENVVIKPTTEKRKKVYNLLLPLLPQNIASQVKIIK